MSRHELANALEHCVRSGEITECQILRECSAIKFRGHIRVREDCLDFRSEKKGLSVPTIVERLDAQPVSRCEDGALAAIPDHEGEHAAEMLYTVVPIFLIEMNDRFGVAARAVVMTLRFKLSSELGVVVNFPIEDDPNIAVLVRNWLMTRLDIDDAQTAHR